MYKLWLNTVGSHCEYLDQASDGILESGEEDDDPGPAERDVLQSQVAQLNTVQLNIWPVCLLAVIREPNPWTAPCLLMQQEQVEL